MTKPTRTIDVQIGAGLRQARLARALTQDDLARLLGLERSAVARYEAGNRPITASMLVQIARALDYPITDLLVAPSPTPMVMPVPATFSPDVTQIAHLLTSQPELIPTVLDLLETLIQGHAPAPP